MYYRARWFDPEISHFAAADTLVPDAYDPLSWDRYLYVRGNSIKFNDPTGHDVGCPASNPACTKLSGYGNEDRAKAYDEYVKELRQKQWGLLQKTGMDQWYTREAINKLYPGTPNPRSGVEKYDNTCRPKTMEKLGSSINSWTPPDDWDLDPSHPDYNVSTLALGPTTFMYTVDRYGGKYMGFGPNFGKGFPVSFSHNIGFIKTVDGMMPMQSDVESFLIGTSLSISAGVVVDVTTTWSPGAGERVAHTVGEYGAFIGMSIGVSLNVYNFKLP